MDSDDNTHRPTPEPAQTHETIAQQLHAVAEDPQIVGAAGLLIGCVTRGRTRAGSPGRPR